MDLHGPFARTSPGSADSSRRSRSVRILLASLLLGSACEGSCSSGLTGPGSVDEDIPALIGVNTRTEGSDLDPNGYIANLGSRSRDIPATGQTSFDEVVPGSYSLGLTDIAPNCTLVSITPPNAAPIVGQNPIQIEVFSANNRFYNFAITCVSNTGTIVVSTQTAGDPGVPNYTAIVTGPDLNTSLPVQPNGNAFVDVSPGERQVQLNGVPPDCLLAGDNPATATVVFAEQVGVLFRVDCTGTKGSLRVITRTSGNSVDPDGYLVNVAGLTIGFSNEPEFSYVWELIDVGDQVVTISDVASNCSVTPASPFTATVPAAQVADVVFDIVCGGVGSVSVDVSTSGPSPDPNGYTLSVGGQSQGVVINPSAPIVFGNLPAGQNVDVLLEDVAPNCTVAEANPQTVMVVEGAVTSAPGFTVTCTSAGTLEVTTSTTGPAAPSGGFAVRIAGNSSPIGVNETKSFPGLPAEDVEVQLLEETATCTVSAPNPRTIAIPAGGTASTNFEISCPNPTPPLIFESNRDGDFDIYAMEADGSGLIALTSNTHDDRDPSWSWDNEKIIFVSDRGGQSDVWVMNADGSNPVQITDDAAENEDPEFSPDGTRIAFEREDPDDGSLELFIANADGTNVTQLTDAAGISEAPHFHPDGSEILFKSNRDGDFEIFLMDVDGSNVRQLTSTSVADFDASWSPDGTRIVFSSERAPPNREDLWIMNRDGSSQTRLLVDSVWDWHPVFSSDGTRIVFTSDRDGDYDLFIMNANGTGVTQLTFNTARDTDAEFKKPIF